MKHDAEWIWHADDDAYPNVDALEKIEKAYREDDNNVVAFCAAVRDVNNENHDISCWRILYKGLFFMKWIEKSSRKKYFDVDKFMYLGCVLSKRILEKVGLTNKEFFIHEDDIEHSMRIRKEGRIVAVTDAILLHPSWQDSRDPMQMNWKHYYSVRNKIISVGINFGEKYRQSEIVKARIKLLLHILKKYPDNIINMEKEAIQDGKNNELGKKASYLPR